MSVQQYKTFQVGGCRGEFCMRKSKFTDVLYFLYAVLVTVLSYTAIMEFESPAYVGAVLVVAFACILLLAKRNLQHFYVEWGSLRVGAAHNNSNTEKVERSRTEIELDAEE